MTLVLQSLAKLNLYLDVLSRRSDGYHEIDSVFTAIDLADTVTLTRASKTTLTVSGVPVPQDATNLAWRAAAALGVTAGIHLDKVIPTGAGLGGGSSNAAAVLRGLIQLYALDVSEERLHDVARSLGADVPYFLRGGTARCRGIGDRVDPVLGAPRRRFLLLLPALSLSTAAVYGALGPGLTANPETATVFTRRYLAEVGPNPAPYTNALQEPAERMEPRLRTLREAAEAAFGTRFCMTGSGAAYFCEVGPWVRYSAQFEGTAELRATCLEVGTS